MTNNDELARNPVLDYADSYRSMAKQGAESVPVWGVITDLERNIAPLYTALLAERDTDKKRIAELEARTVSVKLPKRATAEKYVDGTFDNTDLAAIYNTCRLECEVKIKDACAADGIKLEVGE